MPREHVGQVSILFAVCLLLVVSVGSLVQVVSLPIGMIVTEVVLILVPAIIFGRSKGLSVRETLAIHPVSCPTMVICVIVGIAFWGVAAGIAIVISYAFDHTASIHLPMHSFPQFALYCVIISIGGGICEEGLLRGVIQSVLMRRGRTYSIFVSAALFAILHLNPIVFLPVFTLGALLGYVRARTGSAIPAMIIHTFNNATAVSVAYFWHHENGFAGLVVVLMVGFAASFMLLMRATRCVQASQPALATVPCSIRNPIAWGAAGLVGAPILMAATLVPIGFLLLTAERVAEHAGLGFVAGDVAILVKNRPPSFAIDAGDIVFCRRDGVVAPAVVSRVEGDSAWIAQEGSETELPDSQITGKLIFILRENRLIRRQGIPVGDLK